MKATEIKSELFTRGQITDYGILLTDTDVRFGKKEIRIFKDGFIRITQLLPSKYRFSMVGPGKLMDFIQILTKEQFDEIVRLRELLMKGGE